jgi:cell division protein FtsI (penicillin-binding protein 3)/stage V sporulation protein D (sporulation-specific penicillin-binding protein)
VFRANDFTGIANGTRKNIVTLKARRGDVVDCKGNLLATTRSVVDIGIDPQAIKTDDMGKLLHLAKILDVEPQFIDSAVGKKIKKGNEFDGEFKKVRWVKLKDSVSENVYNKVKELGISGVYGNYKHSRLYPGNKLASHLLGFVNKEGLPVMGTEKFADYYLKGQDGWKVSEKDGKRREMPQFRSLEVVPSDGLNVELSIDWFIQDMVEKELARIVKDYEPIGASMIVSQPTTGAILAMANVPDFDPNLYNKYELGSQRNRALTDLYEPGSTFKIVSVSGCLNEGIVRGEDIIDCSVGVLNRGHRRYRLPSDHHPLGKISVSTIVQKSSNRGAAQMGILLGSRKLYEYCKLFGFGEKTGVGIGGERRGILHHPKNWDGLTITRLPMGHAVSTTPMQIHSAMATIANGGVLMKPKFINRVFDKNGKTITHFNTKPKRRVVTNQVARSLTEMLVSVVSNEGTAKNAKIKGFNIAGKTGTTQKLINGKYSHKHHVGSFVGYFPAEDPEIVITVVVDEAKMKRGLLGYGGTVAAPAFKNVAEKIISYLGISPSNNTNLVGFNQKEVRKTL